MSSEPTPDQPRQPVVEPRPPAHAWAWLQRSRPVVSELARRLLGDQPSAEFVDRVRAEYVGDAFVRDVVIDTIAEVAFGGRVPTRRPPGASWDRGLTWWAARLAGVDQAEFEARSQPPPAAQADLFHGLDTVATSQPAPAVLVERRQLAATLRALLASADSDAVPCSAIRQLVAELER